jgi:hypothetical protein
VRDQPDPEDLSAPITAAESQLLERLRANPIVAARLGAIMDRFEGEVNAGMDAHEAEEMVIGELRGLGSSLLDQWAGRTHDATVEEARRTDPTLIKHGKKNSGGIRPSEPSK